MIGSFKSILLAGSVIGLFGFTKCQTQKAGTQESLAVPTPPPAVTNTTTPTRSNREIFAPVAERLLARGVDSMFVAGLLNDPHITFDESFGKINVTGYLKKADYSHNYNAYSISQNKEFLGKYDSLLTACEAVTGIPKEVVVSVMWVETKHGKYLGKYNVASAYLSLALADQPDNIEKNKKALRTDHPDLSDKELAELDDKIQARAKKKAAWALDQIVALEEMQALSPVPVFELYGSWAGAFGLSQFLPSSYLQWAKDGNNDGKINLFEFPDAVYSIANYLKANGWGNNEKAQRKAVYHYNNSNDYVDAVLILAGQIAATKPEDSTPKGGKSTKIFSPSPAPAPGH